METKFSITRAAAPVREQTERLLRQAIRVGRFRPGDRLIERELCSLLGISRTSLREALRQLEAKGLVVNIPNKGLVVAMIAAPEAQEIYQVREVLEGLTGRLFALQAMDAQRAKLEQAMLGMDQLPADGGQHELLQAEDRFYEALFSGSGNQVVADMLSALHDRIATLRALTLSQPNRWKQSVAELRAILAAIQRHDAEGAQQACADHVRSGAAIALSMLQTLELETKEKNGQ